MWLRRNVANNVRYYRHQRGLSQPGMAALTGLSENTIYLLETPDRHFNVSLRILAAIAHACQVRVTDLLAYRAEQPNPRGKVAVRFLNLKREINSSEHPQ
jgi:transcriptional regulator with XRE-family HTH domain